MMTLLRRISLAVAFAFTLCGGVAQAHPLGNFTINHLAKIAVDTNAGSRTLRVRYVLDIAEIPTFQIMNERAASKTWSAEAAQRWADGELAVVRSGLRLTVDGTPVSLEGGNAHARLRPGAGGLPILYWTADFTARVDGSRDRSIALMDTVYSDRRIGWKDIIVGSQTEPTHELLTYPNDLLGTPRRITAATFTLAPSGAIGEISESADVAPQAGTLAGWFSTSILSDMFSRPEQTPLFVLLTMAAAFALGALHALEPGHGKTLLAFTLVGARATKRQALILAVSLTFAHTIGVLLLGLALFFAAGFVSESIYPWITLLSGIAIAVIGARSLARFVRARRAVNHEHEHHHHGAHPHQHPHDHGHDHDHAHGHSHAIPGSQPLSFSNAIWAAMSGGIAPCPAAIVVLLAALRLHQVGYGLVLIVIFSAGLASVLSALGIGVVHGAAWLSRRSGYAHLAPYGPLVSAVVISAIGAWMVGQGLREQGIAASAFVVAGLTLTAIVGYAFTQHGHSHTHEVIPT